LLHSRLARLLWTCADGAGSLAAHRAAVDLMPAEPSGERASVLAGEAHALMLAARYQESRERCEQAIEVAHTVGARREEGYALNTLGGDLSRLGEPASAVGCLEQALAIAEDVGSVEDVWRAYFNLSIVLNDVGSPERAAVVGRAGAARLETLGYSEGAANLRFVTADALTDVGHWNDADRLAAEALQGPIGDYTRWLLHELRGTIAVRRGDFAAAQVLLGPVRDLWRTGADEKRAVLDAVLVELALGEGRLDLVRTLMEEGLAALAGSDSQEHVQRLVALGLRAEADEACRKLGRREAEASLALARAQRLIERSRASSTELARRGVPSTLRTDVLRCLCEAEMARAERRHEPALWARAADDSARFPLPYWAAYARFRQAEAQLASDDREAAARALRDAHAVAAGLGAAPLVADIETLARRARVRLTTAADERDAGDETGAGLSARELEVLALVAAGHTNREIAQALYITPKTASAHVSHILTKLGVANRNQASALAHRLDLLRASPAS
jgi:DNA-binding CsgD family transcriptional regulator